MSLGYEVHGAAVCCTRAVGAGSRNFYVVVPAYLKAAMMLEHFELVVQLVVVLKPDCVLETIS